MPKKWKTLSSEIVLKTPGVNVRRDCVDMQNGCIVDDFYVFEINEWASIVPMTADGRFVMVEQYRHAMQKITIEFPAGLLDGDEHPLTAAKRELAEETGYTSDNWTPLGAFHLGPAKIKNAFHLFLARDCELTRKQNLDDTEEIRVVTFSPEELNRLFEEGKITDVDSCLGWLLASSKGFSKTS
ncbi:MAG: NUDIX hydrolase [Candidatus Omnitrophica bacterium]|nr:NUDIX hydrolase [Candidatus Omnitrophota bacterium]